MANPQLPNMHRWKKLQTPSLQSWRQPAHLHKSMKENVSIDCGWGNLIFAHTFSSPARLIAELKKEKPGRRDIAFYVKDPHVLLSSAPSEIFLDPSHTFRLWFENYTPEKRPSQHIRVRRLQKKSDVEAVNKVLASQGMVPLNDMYVWKNRNSRTRTLLLAESLGGKEVIGFVMGVNHTMAFNDPEKGSSLWSLCVAKNCSIPKVGETLVRKLAEHYIANGCSFMDLSVMHDNESAIKLYEKLKFVRVPVFTVKMKNLINQKLFAGPQEPHKLNPYTKIIVNEARRRGIKVHMLDAAMGLFQLSWGGVTHICRESLTDLTSSIAFLLCDNKRLTSQLLQLHNYNVPEQIVWDPEQPQQIKDFVKAKKSIVVKPSQGEQGWGVAADLKTPAQAERQAKWLHQRNKEVLIEEFVEGTEVRVIIIGYEYVAAAIRRPPVVTGSGQNTIRELIEKQSRRRKKETGGESEIPIDDITKACIAEQGFKLSDKLPKGKKLQVRKNTNLHTGGTIHDVTDQLHPVIREVCEMAAKDLEIPVVGFDVIVPDLKKPDYWILEANERPGLANHEPQPTAEKFIDFLFPSTIRQLGATHEA